MNLKKTIPHSLDRKSFTKHTKQPPMKQSIKISNLVREYYEKEFMAGFDLDGQEDAVPPLLAFAEPILKLPNEIKLFLHAGETKWFGSVDEDLVNSIINIFIQTISIKLKNRNSVWIGRWTRYCLEQNESVTATVC